MSTEFKGHIGFSAADSTPWWPKPVSPPDGAPNVVLIVLDDTGFAQLGCYGGAVPTPHIDAIADSGEQFSNFHATPLCSPTRASLLTGRNHHSVGMGCLADFNTGFPSQTGEITHSAATLAEVMQSNGYVTYAIGKWHLAPSFSLTGAGPFNQWPLGRGFDHYYGFMWGESDQFRPQLWRDNHHVETPLRSDYHVSEDFVDEAIRNLNDHITSATENPFLLYLAFGAMHAPHQAPPEYLEKYRGQFDQGWDRIREESLARQIEDGVVPAGTQLSPRNPDVPAWDDLSNDEQRLYARMQEAFAAMLDHTDVQIGRLMSHMREQGLLDNTIVVVVSDNGASGEGGPGGSWNEYRYFLNQPDTLEDNLAKIDEIGTRETHNHYPAGWAQAGNTPNKYYKKFTHAGGVRTPLIVSWQDHVAPGRKRADFRHVTDIMPTLLEAAGLSAPEQYRGIPQMPVHGQSFLSTLGSDSPQQRTGPQYFEMIGNRALWLDGFKAVALHEEGTSYDDDRWELYNVVTDFSECNDLAGDQPEVLKSMIEEWFQQAKAYDVFPLDDRLGGRADVRPQYEGQERLNFRLLPHTQPIASQAAPDFFDRSFVLTATVVRSAASQNGVLIAQGHHANGWAFYVHQNRLVLDYNLAGTHTVLRSSSEVPLGERQLGLHFSKTGRAQARVELQVDGQPVAELPQLATIPNFFGPHSVEVGRNAPSPIGFDYDSPNDFQGRLRWIDITLGTDKGSSSSSIDAALATE